MDPAVTASVASTGRDSSMASYHGRFLPGTLVGKRFRIVERLGAGGMGEVFRADDLELGHPVALKFVPQSVARDAEMISRLRDEVRFARQVSHPNVCRVYDLSEVEGEYFLCMEYVDGEDLASVLRRMGRPSSEKALQIARQLCAGLAAAHEAGILHRDLKPANVMIDGRGRARITDFGLAGLAEDIHQRDTNSGTPAYMAPEQLTGRGVSVRSDIYSLGLVLYELFTGKRAFEADTVAELREIREESHPPTPSSVVDGLDPAIERVILKCLEIDPRDRPPSSLAVASALPGGDPLAAALAAGETPSPELLAASGEVGVLRPSVALPLVATVLAGLLCIAWVTEDIALYGLVKSGKAPAVLADRGASIVGKFGYTDKPADQAFGFSVDYDQLSFIAENNSSPERWNHLNSVKPSPIAFWYRQSPMYLGRWSPGDGVTAGDPPLHIAGMSRVWLDSRGLLVAFHCVPPQVVRQERSASEPFDWSLAFREAGLDIAAFEVAEPEWTPLMFADERRAWKGWYPGQPERTVRVEAAGYQGKPVSFQVLMPYDTPGRMPQRDTRSASRVAADWLSLLTLLTAVFGGALIARRNLRLGRGDRRGAFRLAAAVFVMQMAFWILRAHHASGEQEFDLWVSAVGRSLFTCAWMWLMYMALEPYARRHWPETLIAWSRLISGRWRDPLVGRSVLIGFVAGVLLTLVDVVIWKAYGWLGMAPPMVGGRSAFNNIAQTRDALGMLIGHLEFLISPIMFLFISVLVKMVVRNRVAAVVIALLFGAVAPNLIRTLTEFSGMGVVLQVVKSTLPFAVGGFLFFRPGMLSLMAFVFVENRLGMFPVTLDSTAWYSGISTLILVILAGMAVWSCHASLGSRMGRMQERWAMSAT